MSTTFILATTDPQLAAAWEAQFSPEQPIVRLFSAGSQSLTQPGLSAVVILDASAEQVLPGNLVKCPTIFVGEPRSLPFEQARMAGRAKVYLSYEESSRRLGEFLPLMAELASKESMLALVVDKGRRTDGFGSRSPMRVPAAAAATETAELWDTVFVSGGRRGFDIELAPADLVRITDATLADIAAA